LRDILHTLPRLDQEDRSFPADVLAVVAVQPAMPESLPWE